MGLVNAIADVGQIRENIQRPSGERSGRHAEFAVSEAEGLVRTCSFTARRIGRNIGADRLRALGEKRFLCLGFGQGLDLRGIGTRRGSPG